MKKHDITVEYIFHSGFTFDTKDYFFVFDYFKGDIKLPDKPVVVFVSHGILTILTRKSLNGS